ncbi:MAG: crotonase/enoyl-CoA hydratase family protein [Alphaproteobacteria bacterium]|nr:crotonase/enoyl-CoA hydratase family protein [Alphaproteobacteria bacterium]
MSLLTYELRDKVAWLGLNRPEKRNAISEALLSEFDAAIGRAGSEARVMVLFGHGSCFSAGLDLAEQRDRSTIEVFEMSRRWHDVMTRLRVGRTPAIAVLHGPTIGGGLEIAAACHLRIADASAVFAFPEGQRGIYVGGGASVFVARLFGAARLTDMMLTGRVLDAEAAERSGLVQYLVPLGAAQAKAAEIAAKVADVAPLTVMGVLQALPRIQDMAEADGLFVESLVAAISQSGSEAKRRLTEFVERRAQPLEKPGA